jgi:hypothetical protein
MIGGKRGENAANRAALTRWENLDVEQGQNDFEQLESRSAIRLAAIALGASRSVLLRQHHCQNTRRDVGIGWIRRHQLHFSVIKIDLPEAPDIVVLDKSDVVLTVRVVVVIELVERADLGEDQATPVGRQRFKARRDDHDAADERSAKGVVELLDAGDSI